MVDVSWIAKPCERSSRCMRLRCPPDLGAWAGAGVVDATTPARPSEIAMAKVRERFIVLLSLRRPSGQMVVVDRAGVGKSSQNIRHGRWSDNPSAPPHPHAARYRRGRGSRGGRGGWETRARPRRGPVLSPPPALARAWMAS